MLSVGRKPAECSWDLCFTDSQKAIINVGPGVVVSTEGSTGKGSASKTPMVVERGGFFQSIVLRISVLMTLCQRLPSVPCQVTLSIRVRTSEELEREHRSDSLIIYFRKWHSITMPCSYWKQGIKPILHLSGEDYTRAWIPGLLGAVLEGCLPYLPYLRVSKFCQLYLQGAVDICPLFSWVVSKDCLTRPNLAQFFMGFHCISYKLFPLHPSLL